MRLNPCEKHSGCCPEGVAAWIRWIESPVKSPHVEVPAPRVAPGQCSREVPR